jgi:DNA-directed RNA polymerase specialized sigma subunit
VNPAEQLKDIDRQAREAAAAYKRQAVALVAEVYDREGSQSKAAKVLGISQGRVSQLLKEQPGK